MRVLQESVVAGSNIRYTSFGIFDGLRCRRDRENCFAIGSESSHKVAVCMALAASFNALSKLALPWDQWVSEVIAVNRPKNGCRPTDQISIAIYVRRHAATYSIEAGV